MPSISTFSGFVAAAYLAMHHGGTQASLGGVIGSRYLFMHQKDKQRGRPAVIGLLFQTVVDAFLGRTTAWLFEQFRRTDSQLDVAILIGLGREFTLLIFPSNGIL